MTSSRKVGNLFGYSKKDTKENLGSCNNMEELLNKLIKKGWKPFGITCTDFIKGTGLECIPSYCFNPHPHMWFPWWTRKYHRPSLRQIVSKESWLWQFVCENGMVKGFDTSEYYTNYRRFNKENFTECRYLRECQYRIIESSLKNESELEDFLLSNIKLD